jgi:hypothetical protein
MTTTTFSTIADGLLIQDLRRDPTTHLRRFRVITLGELRAEIERVSALREEAVSKLALAAMPVGGNA